MNRPSRTVLALVAVLVAGCCALLVRAHVRGTHLTEADRRLRFAFDWPRGTTYDYAFSWRGESTLEMPELGGKAASDQKTTLGGRVDLDGEIVLASYGKEGDVYRLSARINRLGKHTLEMLGKDVLASDATARELLVGPRAVVEMDPTGKVGAIYFDHDAPPLFQHVMRQLLSLAEVTVHADGASAWTVDETTTLGHGIASYEVEGASPPRLERTRAPYQAIFALPGRTFAPGQMDEAAHTTIALDERGVLGALVDDETLAVARPGAAPSVKDFTSRSHFTFDLHGTGSWTPPPLDVAALTARTPGNVALAGNAAERMLEQRVRGLTYDDMKTSLLAFPLTGTLPGKDWLLRASGFLKLHPEHCMDLVAVFEDPAMNDRGRLQIANLLAGTGTPAAQAAMRAALESPSAHATRSSYASLIQSFSAVAHPTPESLAFVDVAFAEAKAGDDRAASAYALGGAAGNALRNGNVVDARRYDATLVRSLRAATAAGERRTLLGAIGNVGVPEDTAEIAKLGQTDDDEDVRAAAAWALRKIDSTDARGALVSIAADASPSVERSAFEALATQPLAPSDLAALASTVTSGGTRPATDGALLALLVSHPDGGQPVKAMLAYLAARNGADNTMLANIRHALAAMT